MSSTAGTEKKGAAKLAEAGRRLAAWFNSNHARRRPVAKLLGLTQFLIQLHTQEKPYEDSFEVEEYKAEIDQIARLYPSVRELERWDPRARKYPRFYEQPMRKDARSIEGWQVLRDLGILTEGGALWRVRRCRLPLCKRTFYARNRENLYCSPPCQDAAKESAGTRKEKKRLKSRTAYWNSRTSEQQEKLLEKRAKRKAKNKSNFDEYLRGR